MGFSIRPAEVLANHAGWRWRPACMARPYSLDLRERVVVLVSDGVSCRDVAELTDIVASTVVKWTQPVTSLF